MESGLFEGRMNKQTTTATVSLSFELISHTCSERLFCICYYLCDPSVKSSSFRNHKLCIHIVLLKHFHKSSGINKVVSIQRPIQTDMNSQNENLLIAHKEILLKKISTFSLAVNESLERH